MIRYGMKKINPLILLLLLISCNQLPQNSGSGLRSAIYGGNPVVDNQFRGVVAIGIKHCTGTLISPTEVITAAHCVVSLDKKHTSPRIIDIPYKVTIGNKYNSIHSSRYGIKYAVVHPKYNFNKNSYNNYDVAYLKLSKAVANAAKHTIPVATRNEINQLANTTAEFVGFGRTDQPNKRNDKFHVTGKINRIGKEEIFAGGRGKGICYGDSGGPLLAKINGKLKLVGVTSQTYSYYPSSTPDKSCRDEGIFSKADLGTRLASSDGFIQKYIETNNSNYLYYSDRINGTESWASFYNPNNTIFDSKRILHTLPWLEDDTDMPLTHYQKNLARGIGFFYKNLYDKALDHLIRAQKAEDTPTDATYYIARVLIKIGDMVNAMNQIEQLLVHHPDEIKYLEVKARIFLLTNDHQNARAILAKLPLQKSNLKLRIYNNIFTGDQEQAIELINTAINKKMYLDEMFPGKGNLLLMATKWGQDLIAEALIDAGIDVNIKQIYGGIINTFSNRGNYAVVKKLITAGANLNAPDNYGYTALHKAAKAGHEQIVRLLVSNGADYKLKINSPSQTPVQIAKSSGHYNIATYLESLP